MEENNVKINDNATAVDLSGDRLSKRNFIMYPLGTFGRDFLYNVFVGYLLTFILLTKNLTTAQFSIITVIIICARVFDAFNDPIMGGIVENTRTKWGKYKPWQLIGAVTTGVVIIALFNVKLTGWSFIGFFAFAYFMFSITFTMNDISYWGMMPSLTSNPDDRNKLTSFTQLVASAGGGLCSILVPALTVGAISQKVLGGAVRGYSVMSIFAAVIMVGFQMFTLFGVKEKPLPVNFEKTERMRLKDMFSVLFKNDQLLWCTLIMLLWSILSGVCMGNLMTFYIYFEFSYNGTLFTVFGVIMAVFSVLFTLFYPWFSKKLGRDRTLYSTGICLIVSYSLLMILGLSVPNVGGFTVMGIPITVKFLLMMIAYGVSGWASGFYMIMLINISNTVEYNEYRTGKREEALIFSLRPFTAKLGSAITQGIVSLVLIIVGATAYTNKISDLENLGTTTGEDMTGQITEVINSMSQSTKNGILICMCVIPIVLMAAALLIYKFKCNLNEETLAKMVAETQARKAAEDTEVTETMEDSPFEISDDVAVVVATEDSDGQEE